jgi:hypothetical protein
MARLFESEHGGKTAHQSKDIKEYFHLSYLLSFFNNLKNNPARRWRIWLVLKRRADEPCGSKALHVT